MTIKDAMESIDSNKHGICFVIDKDSKVIGVLTDGDIRQSLLSGTKLEDPIKPIFNRNFVYVKEGFTRETIIKLFDNNARVIPILSNNKKLVDIATIEHIPFCDSSQLIVQSISPARITFAGGGSDINNFFKRSQGAVINAAISLYARTTAIKRNDNKVIIESAELGSRIESLNLKEFMNISDNFDLIRSVFKVLKPNFGLEVYLNTDFPIGSGLGGSSAVAISLIACLNKLMNLNLRPYQISEIAYEAERLQLGINGGWQDQYACSFGGFNYIEFNKHKNIVYPLRLSEDLILAIQESLLLFKLPNKRSESGHLIHSEQKNSVRNQIVFDNVKRAVRLCKNLKNDLLCGQHNSIGKILDEAWKLKKTFSTNVSNDFIDLVYNAGVQAGANGGKLMGAGSSGFILFHVNPSKKRSVIETLSELDLTHIPFSIDAQGTRSWATS